MQHEGLKFLIGQFEIKCLCMYYSVAIDKNFLVQEPNPQKQWA